MAEEKKVPEGIIPENTRRYLDLIDRRTVLRKALEQATDSEVKEKLKIELDNLEYDYRKSYAYSRPSPTSAGAGQINEQGYFEAKDNRLNYNAKSYVQNRFSSVNQLLTNDVRYINRVLDSLDAGRITLDIGYLSDSIQKQVRKELNDIIEMAEEKPKYNIDRDTFDKNYWTEEFEKTTYPQFENLPEGKLSPEKVLINKTNELLERIITRVELPEGFELLEDAKYNPQAGREYTIVHKNSGLELKFSSNSGLYIDNDASFKTIDGRKVTYGQGDILNPISRFDDPNAKPPPQPPDDPFDTWDDKPPPQPPDPLDDFDGPPYDAQTMDADLLYDDPGPRPTPGNIAMGPDGPYEETVQDAVDWDYEQELLREEADAEDRRLDMQAEEERLRAQGYLEYGDPLDDFDGPPYDAQTMDADRPSSGDMADVKENLVNEIDKQSGQPGMGMKALDLAGKIAGPIDETLLVTLQKGIPRLFAGTALAGAAAAGGSAIATGLMYLSVANLVVAGIRGAGTFAKEYGGDTSKAIDAILAGEIPEKTFVEAVKESSKEGFTEFGKQMEYDPFYFIVDKTILQPIFGKDQGVIIEKGMEGIQYLFGGQEQGSYKPPYGNYTKKYGQYGVDY